MKGLVRVYRYRLYPTVSQAATMRRTLECLRELYNAALQERRDAWKKQGVAVSAYQQMAQLKAVRADREDIRAIHVHLAQDAITRVDRAYQAFFRRCKAGDVPGFPRFKGRGRYRTFTFKDAKNRNGVRLVAGGQRVDLTGVGRVKVRLHRPIEGVVKQASVTLDGDGHWYIAFVCADVPARPLPRTGASAGIDVGISAFAVLHNGERIESPRFYERAQKRIARAQRRVARRGRGSHRRRKAGAALARTHHRIACIRRDFHHKVAAGLVRRFDSVAVEDLNVKGLARARLAKQVHDAGWAQFVTILAHKAESAGRELVRVDPRGTSQECSGCGSVVRKGLADRIHSCMRCGLVLDRDHNAAINIKGRLGCSRRGGLSNG